MARTIKIGTRKSALALAQAKMVQSLINQKFPHIKTELVLMTTKGDKITDKPLIEVGGKGVFIAEFEKSLLEGGTDIAVHSAKDLDNIADRLTIGAVLKRGNPKDVLVTLKGRSIEKNQNAVIGTGSLRRIAQIQNIFPSCTCKGLRGNVDTRLKKLKNGEYDGIILAAAGLERLGISESDGYEFKYFSENEFVPAACQGIIAIECRKDDNFTKDILSQINDEKTMLSFKIERELLGLLGADCHEAAGIYSQINGESIEITAFYKNSGIKKMTAPKSDLENLLKHMAGELK